MKLCSIASGSSGNCIFAGSETTSLLIDAGISGKRVEAGLAVLDRSAKELDGILVTHEHSDHIQGLGVLARNGWNNSGDAADEEPWKVSGGDFSHDSRG